MRKGIILALTLVVMVLLVGCGVQNQLTGTKWQHEKNYVIYSGTTKEGTGIETTTWEFKKDGTLIMSTKDVYTKKSGIIDTDETSETTKWYCDGDKLYIESSEYPMAEIYDVIILDDELILKQGFDYTKYKKVN
jgi:uncharacterized lipoprotein NlpE involved in copper resistance